MASFILDLLIETLCRYTKEMQYENEKSSKRRQYLSLAKGFLVWYYSHNAHSRVSLWINKMPTPNICISVGTIFHLMKFWTWLYNSKVSKSLVYVPLRNIMLPTFQVIIVDDRISSGRANLLWGAIHKHYTKKNRKTNGLLFPHLAGSVKSRILSSGTSFIFILDELESLNHDSI